jgi:hypothetical protein
MACCVQILQKNANSFDQQQLALVRPHPYNLGMKDFL